MVSKILHSLLAILIASALSAQTFPFLEDSSTLSSTADYSDPNTLIAAAQQCTDSPDSADHTDLCRGTFYCGDGGCDPQGFLAFVHPDQTDRFFSLIASLPVIEVHECSPLDSYERQFVDSSSIVSAPYVWGFTSRLQGEDYVAYCGETFPGFEIDTVLSLRQENSIVLAAMREGGMAGLPPLALSISASDFYSLRGPGIASLRSAVVSAIEELIGQPCRTEPSLTCNIVATQGRIQLELLAPGTEISGRTDHWERSYWEFYPYQMFADMYALSIDLPITSVRRWPTSGQKPIEGFVSLDFDPGFESMQRFVASRLSEELGATIPPWW